MINWQKNSFLLRLQKVPKQTTDGPVMPQFSPKAKFKSLLIRLIYHLLFPVVFVHFFFCVVEILLQAKAMSTAAAG